MINDKVFVLLNYDGKYEVYSISIRYTIFYQSKFHNVCLEIILMKVESSKLLKELKFIPDEILEWYYFTDIF